MVSRSRWMVALAAAAGALALPSPASAQVVACPGAGIPPTTGNGPVMRAAVVCLVNNERIARGLAPVWGQVHLDLAAQRHTDDMAARGYFDHTAPPPAPFGASVPARAQAAGYPSAFVGENLALGNATPAEAVAAWMASPGHCRNILNGAYQHAGVGVTPPRPLWALKLGAIDPQPETPAVQAACPVAALVTPGGGASFAPAPPGEGEPGYLSPAKLRVTRAGDDRGDRVLDVLAPITALAAGTAKVEFEAAGRTTSFTARIRDADSDLDVIRFEKRIPVEQARKGTGILTISYPGSKTTRPQEVRLRAASNPARLRVERIALDGHTLTVNGRLSSRASGVVRIEVSYQTPDGKPHTWSANTKVGDDGDWRLVDDRIPPEVASGGGYVSVLFTGDLDARMRGEMLSYAIGPGQTREP